MKVLLIINKPARETPIMRAIESRIMKIDPSSSVSLLDVHEPGFIFKALELAPDVILTFPFTAIPLSRPFYLLKYLLGCFILCYRTEGAISFSSPSQVRWLAGMDKYGPTLVDHELFWGPATAAVVGDELMRQGKLSGKDRVHVVGYPPYERYLNNGSPVASPLRLEGALSRIAGYPKEKILFFITGFHLADYSAQDLVNAGDCFDPAAPDAGDELALALDGVEKAKQFRTLWIENIQKAARQNPDMLFIVKCHPIEWIIHQRNNDDPYEVFYESPNILYIREDVQVADIMPLCGLFFHYGSTCVAESYLLNIPSVFVSSHGLYNGGTDTASSNYYYSDLGWPSSHSIDIENITQIISKYRTNAIPFIRIPEMENVLHKVFDITPDHLNGHHEYTPSEEIAGFLLSLQKASPLLIDESDSFFRTSLSNHCRTFLEYLIQRALKILAEGAYREAISFLDHAVALAKASGYKVQGLYYHAAYSYYMIGNSTRARELLLSELTVNPGHAPSVALLEALQDTPKAKPAVTAVNEELDRTAPEIFSLETALACNLRCPECAIGGGMIERSKGFLPFEKFRIAADKIRPFAKLFFLHIWGEPMLNREIIPMVRYASRFCRTNISTNGMILTPELAEELITSGVAEIIVSIDGVTQEVYEKYRVGGDVKKAFNALELLQRFNRKHETGVRILPQFIVFKHNQHEMRAFRERCNAMGLNPFFKSPYIRTKGSCFSYSDFPEFRRPHLKDVPSLKQAMRECPNARNVFTILMDGSVVACCHDYAEATTFGNIFEQGVLEIWNNPAYREFRRSVLEGKAPKFCMDNCMSYFLDAGPSAQSVSGAAASAAEPQRESSVQKKINLCSGSRRLDGYINIDLMPGADIALDLERQLLPFEDNSIDILVCMSAINYFYRDRGVEIVRDVHRVLKPGGIARFGTQDLRLLAGKYLNRDESFYFEKLPNGHDRFPGKTYADKLNEFFYGFRAGDKHCKYVYDFESLREVFLEAGFRQVEQMRYRQSRLSDVAVIDNRPEQMFFLEAVKAAAATDIAGPGKIPSSPQPAPASDAGDALTGFRLALRRIRAASGDAAAHPAPAPPQPKAQATLPEAEKPRDKALTLWRQGDRLRGWQWLCSAFESSPEDKELFQTLGQVLRRQERWGDLAKLFDRYLAANPQDTEVRAARQVLPPAPPPPSDRNFQAAIQRPDIARLLQRENSRGPDRRHLDAAVKWLLTAQGANPGGGVSAMHYMAIGQWDVDYPETTGYIIPTLLAYARLTGESAAREAAVKMGNWEIEIQTPEGGAGEPLGVFGLRPRIFNTGQVILGWISLYRETGSEEYLSAARRAADWITENLEADGRWVKATYSGPRAYKSRVGWALLELYAATGNRGYLEAAERSLGWILSQARENGWFENNSLSEPGKPWTHLIGYVLAGLLETARLRKTGFDVEKILRLLNEAAKGVTAHTLAAKERAGNRFVTLAGTFDRNWQSTDGWSCVTGTAQVEFFLRRLSRYVDDPRLVQTADLLLDDLKRLQFIDGIDNIDIFGGLPGSVPLNGPYCPYAVPNWGVKFFADCLLQRLLPPSQQDCLG